ncbi:MAG: excinuclease ABC subunit C, partial [Bacteroidales bacterium]|nr:excinuclease ABC subunit C [Bacteroidales bacterium]
MTVKEKIQLFPHSPGVYRYYDAAGNVIYVGKAKDLHKRVAQYFVPPERLNTKTRVLVSKIADAQYSVVDSEADALLLENNLIKQYKPKYNILLKDSKTYPWICVSSDTYPRVYITRRVEKGAGRYFGPYSSALAARNLVDFFHHTYRLRTCKYKIDSQSILMRKYRPCLDYQIGRCSGPCIGAISQQDYLAGIEEIVNLLKGGANDIIQKYRQEMERASDALEFERAQQCKMMLDALQNHYSKSIISAARDMNLDVFSLVFEGFEAFGNFFRVRGGAIIQSLNLGFKMNIEEDRASVLSAFIAEIEAKFGELSAEVIVPFLPDVQIEGVSFKIPARGDKLSLLELSSKNAKEYQFNSMKQRERTNPDEFRQTVLEELRKALGMKELPVHMECFDNSNIQGTNPVASCVVFRDGEP